RSRWPLPARAKAAIDQALKRLDATGSTDNGGGLGSLKSYSREKLHAVDVIVPASKDRFEVWYIGKGGEELGFFNANLAYTHEPPSLPTRLDLNKIPSPPTTAGLSPALQLPLLGNRYLTLLATDVDLISDLYEEYLEDRNWGRVTVEDGWAKVRAQHWGYWRSRTPSRAAVLPLLEQRGDRGFSLDQLARLAKRFRGQPESLLRFYDRVLGMQTSLTNPWLLLWADLSQEQRTSFKKDATVRLRELPASALEGVRAVLFSRRDAGDCGTIAVEDFLEKEPFASFGFITRGTPKPPSPQDLKEGYLRGRWAEVPGTNSASTHSTSLSSAENKELVIQEGALLEIVLPGGSGARGRLRSARRQ
ncbi:MAG TPA: hypothetical protein VEX38_06950, partial [Fimbriimonadaceae bacterium]|nr:hypothetical protein [Fimbriimonadaceae bacterium]